MCGIAGLMRSGAERGWLATQVAGMASALAHRGPDAQGVWVEESAGLALGHRRLSIIDLSEAGAQPMVSPSGRHVIVFNGEIYNFRTLRQEMLGLGARLRGHSDTEVLLAAIDAFGLDAALARCTGMFAFGLWDRLERRLTLVRDRCGEKPLYYGSVGGTLVFASELKALRALPGWPAPIDRTALELYFRHGCVPAPHCIHSGLAKLRPGELVEFDDSARVVRRSIYWESAQLPDRRRPAPVDARQAVAELDQRLRNAVSACMISDVPLGAFLSGGLDSATVVSIMQACSPEPVRTFTIGFGSGDYDEAALARRVATQLGTRHTEVIVGPDDALEVVPELPSIYDEPFADSSQIPTFLVSRIAREQVTVALSGDGGDEVFGGYNRYTWGAAGFERTAWLPLPVRRALGAALTAVPGPAWDRLGQAARALLPGRLRPFSPGDRVHKLARLIGARDADELYRHAVTYWAEPPLRKTASVVADDPWALANFDGASLAERMMLSDLRGYLADDVLVKVDRASMAVSLECRVPLLDHQLVEWAWSLPPELRIRSGQGKWILRQVLARYLPEELFSRPKMGFALPIDQWLRGPLRDWAEALLSRERLESHGLLNADAVREAWLAHVVHGRQQQARLWAVLMFQAWHEASFR